MTNALIVGLGAAGQRHARILKGILPGVRVVGVSRTTAPVPHVDLVLSTIEQALQEEPTVAVVAGPATTRISTAHRLGEAGVHLLLEKPLAADMEGIEEFRTMVTEGDLTVAVGYNLRFFEPLLTTKSLIAGGAIGPLRGARVEVGQYLPDWRPGADYRRSVSAQRDLGGGALLELSHELDYARWIMGEAASVSATVAQAGLVDLDVEDTAELLVTFDSGVIASVHLDMLQRPAIRYARFVGEGGSIVTDLLRGTVTVAEAGGGVQEIANTTAAEVDLTYVAQMNDFLSAVESSGEPRVPLGEGVATLELVSAARESAAKGRAVSLDPASRRP